MKLGAGRALGFLHGEDLCAGSEVRVSGTFTALAIRSQHEAGGTGTAVGARRVLTRVLAQAARRGPALVHICGRAAGRGWVAHRDGRRGLGASSLHPRVEKRGLGEDRDTETQKEIKRGT